MRASQPMHWRHAVHSIVSEAVERGGAAQRVLRNAARSTPKPRLAMLRGLWCCLAGCAALIVTTTVQAGIAERAVRAEVAGIEVVVYPMEVEDVVTLVGTLPAGDWYARQNGGNPATATLTAMLLDKGTTKQDKFSIARQLDGVGAMLGFQAGELSVSINGKSLKKDIGTLIRLMAEQLRSPALSPEEFDKAKKQLEASVRRQLDNTGALAGITFSRAIFPPDHPNAPAAPQELLKALESATIEQVRAFHDTHYGPAHMTLVFTGDADPRLIQAEVRKAFAGWSGGTNVVRSATHRSAAAAEDLSVSVADKASVSIMLGQATGLRYQDKDRHALAVGTAILGSGFTGRLMNTVRDKEGLTYGIGAGMSGDTYVDGAWYITATFAPELLERGIASTRRELQKWWRDGVSAEELEHRKTNLVGSFQVALATTGGMAASLATSIERGVGIEWLDRYPSVIESLTLEEVNAAIRKYLDPEKMVLVKAGTLPPS